MRIPFFDLTRQLQSWPELNETVRQVMEKGQFIGGEPVQQFEKNFAKRLNIPHCIGTANGTDALFLILKALRLPEGSEIITPAWSCMPTAETIVLAGYQPVFCDVDDDHMVLTPKTVESKITARTRAIIAVHLYGQAAPVHQLKQLCEANHIHLIEDCAQAHLTLEDGKPVGSFGTAAAFSFYPTKNLGALGDAGCVVTANTELALRIRMLANHGSPPPEQYNYQLTGVNSRLDTLQAALLNVKLTRLDELNQKRRSIAERYHYLLADLNEIRLPKERSDTCHTWHIYCIRSGRRDALREHLSRSGVGSHIHYPVALPFTPAFAYLKHSVADFPVAAQLAQEVLSLPVFPELTPEEVEFIAESLRSFLKA